MESQTMLRLHMLEKSIRKSFERSPVVQDLNTLTGMHCWIIGYLADHEPEDIYQRDLEKEFGSCRSAISKMLAAMEHNGLVVRERVASDDRLKKIVLTPLAKQYIEQIRAENRRLEDALTCGFSAEELDTLVSYLTRMQNNLSASSREDAGKEQL